jgi:hypothetical protein
MELKNIIIIIFAFVVFYFLKKKESLFTQIEQPLMKKQETDIYHLDTRYEYPTVPPANPNVYKSLLVKSVPASSSLYSGQEFSTNDYILDQNQIEYNNTNQLDYSGGSTQLLKIPLQMNEPYNEQLRSQEILITPYNKIKYNITKECNAN